VKLRTYNTLAGQVGVRPQSNFALLSIHGVRSTGDWQKRMAVSLQYAGILYDPLDWGYARLLPIVRPQSTADAHTTKVVTAWKTHDDAGLHVIAVAHSFGTLILARSLQLNPEVILPRIVLFGSILSESFPWRDLAARHQVSKLLNETCPDDPAVRFAHLLRCKWTGRAGCFGFSSTGIVENRVYDWLGHSDAGNLVHVEKVWIPFLLRGVIPPQTTAADHAT
jgi:hypothetical protein